MSLIKIINSEHSAEFGQLITDIKANVLSYLEARQKAQKERMIIIGKIAAYKSIYHQRSKEHRALTTAMNEEGWSQDVISNNLVAYKQYKSLLESHSDWHPLAEAASVSHLILIAREQSGSLLYDSVMYLKCNKQLPSIKAMKGYLGGFFDNKFQPKFRTIGCRRDSFSTPELTTSNTTKQPETQKPTGSALIPIRDEAIEIPLNDGQFVIHQDSTDIEHEAVKPSQKRLIQQLNLIVNQIDIEEVFVDDALRSQLEPFQHQLETLSDLAKPRIITPKHL